MTPHRSDNSLSAEARGLLRETRRRGNSDYQQCGIVYLILHLRGFGHGVLNCVCVGTVTISWVGTLNDWLRLKVHLGSKPIVSVLKDRGLRNHLSLGSLLHRHATPSSH